MVSPSPSQLRNAELSEFDAFQILEDCGPVPCKISAEEHISEILVALKGLGRYAQFGEGLSVLRNGLVGDRHVL